MAPIFRHNGLDYLPVPFGSCTFQVISSIICCQVQIYSGAKKKKNKGVQKAVPFGNSLPGVTNIPVNIRNWSKAASLPLQGVPPADTG